MKVNQITLAAGQTKGCTMLGVTKNQINLANYSMEKTKSVELRRMMRLQITHRKKEEIVNYIWRNSRFWQNQGTNLLIYCKIER